MQGKALLRRANSRDTRSDQEAGGRGSRTLPALTMQELWRAGLAQLLPLLQVQVGLVFAGQPLSLAEEGKTSQSSSDHLALPFPRWKE